MATSVMFKINKRCTHGESEGSRDPPLFCILSVIFKICRKLPALYFILFDLILGHFSLNVVFPQYLGINYLVFYYKEFHVHHAAAEQAMIIGICKATRKYMFTL